MEGAASEDARALHMAERSMLKVVDPGAKPHQAAGPGAARVAVPGAAPVEAPAAGVDQRIEDNVSENEINSQSVAFETSMSEQPWNREARGSGKTNLRELRARRWPDRFWPDRVSGGGNCPRTLKKSRDGGTRVVMSAECPDGRKSDRDRPSSHTLAFHPEHSIRRN
jgi:hypothetical protein